MTSLSILVDTLKFQAQSSYNLFGKSFESNSASYFNSSIIAFEFQKEKYILKTSKKFSNLCGLFSTLFTHYERFTTIKKKLIYEKEQLIKMNQVDLPVPLVIDINISDTLVTKYLSGQNPKDILKNKNISLEEKLEMIGDLSYSLSQIHKYGFFQGSPSVKNTRYSNSKGYWLDFGTIANDKFSIEYLQTMDINGFIYSACRNCISKRENKDKLITKKILQSYTHPPILSNLINIQPDKIPLWYSLIIRKRKPSDVEIIQNEIINHKL